MAEVLTEKQYKSYDYISRYQPFPYYYNRQDGKYIYGITSWLNNATSYTIHTVERQEENYDYLAYLYYGDPTKYWVICDFNRVRDPLEKLEIGREIKIPSISELSFI